MASLLFIPTQKWHDLAMSASAGGASRAARLVRRTAGVIIALVILWTLTGFLLLPVIAKHEIQQLLSAELERPVTLQSVSFNPFTLEGRLRNFVVQDAFGTQPLLSVDELLLDVSVRSLLHLAPVVQHLQVTHPVASIVRLDATRYNFSDILAKQLAKARSDEKPFPFSVFNVELVDGRIDFDDRPERIKHAVSGIRLGIPFLSSFPADVNISVRPTLEARVNDDPLRIVGDTKPFKDTLETTLDLEYSDIDLARYMAYAPIELKFRVSSGKLDTKLRLVFATKASKPSNVTLAGTASLRGLAVQHANGAPAIAVKAIKADIDRAELIEQQIVLHSVRVDAPDLRVVRRADGTLSLIDLAAASTPSRSSTAPSKPWLWSVDQLVLTNGRAELEDRLPAQPFRTVLAPIDATVTKLGNAPDAEAQVAVAFATDFGTKVEHSGSLSLVPFSAHGHVTMTSLPVARLKPYYAPYLNVDIGEGRLDFAGDYTTGESKGVIAPQLRNVSVGMADLRLLTSGVKQPLWRVPLLAITGASIDTERHGVSITDAVITNPTGYLLRGRDGKTQYDALLKSAPADKPAAGRIPAASDSQWSVQAARVTISNAAVTIDDRVPPHPVVTKIGSLDLSLANASTVKGASATLSGRGRVNQRGMFNVSGLVSAMPVKGKLAVRTQDLALAPFQPYVEDRLNVALNAGALSNNGTLSFDASPGKPLSVLYQGDAAITGMAVVTKSAMQDLLRWKSLRVAGVSFALEPLKADVEGVSLDDFYARVVLNPDGIFNLQQLIARREENVAPSSPQPAETASTSAARNDAGAKRSIETTAQAAAAHALPPYIRVGNITFGNGNVNFSDYYVKPNYTANLTGLNGTVSEMTPDKPGDVAIRAKIDDAAPVTIDGRINALSQNLLLDITASAKDIDLPPLSPYSVKYAGYGIVKGKLSATVKYHVEDRTLTAENAIYLDQLTFGEHVDSPTATKLPVLLAVALLKDRNGVIDINLPISGSLDDPHFSVGGLIVRVIVNLITKAVTAPFALIGAVFGGGPELSYIEFTAGSAVLDDAALKRLDALAKALDGRPGLRLEVSGRTDPAPDREALKAASLRAKVKAQKVRELMREGAESAALESATIDKAEYEKFLKRAYAAEKFDKPRNMLGFAKDIPVPEMEQLILANTQVSDEDLRVLANQRAQSAKSFLVDKGRIAGERIFLVAPVLTAEGVGEGKSTRVDFSLRN